MEIPQEIIRIKREGAALTQAQIEQFIKGVVSGEFRDYQSSALLMAIVLQGMNDEETAWLTAAMARSGRRIELPEIERPKVDKHSTGGVGDKVSLILAPLAASVGLCVPMVSGRGLGHTGGTLDKLEAIPGFVVELDDAAYRAQLARMHLAIIGQSADLVPADRKLYALRDVTATVESIPLICASILSKKLAAGIDALVLDVKCGSGAFMPTEAQARSLAEALVRVSTRMGQPTTALITRMDQPLGCCVGNALEVIEAIECLKGNGPGDLMALTYELTAEMMRLGGLVEDREAAMRRLRTAIADGRALRAFRDLIEAQGGDVAVVDSYDRFPQAKGVYDVCSESAVAVYIAHIDALRVGEAARMLGAGRMHVDDVIDCAVGLECFKKVGDRVQPGEALCRIFYNDSEKLDSARGHLKAAYSFSNTATNSPDLFIDWIRGV